MSARPDVTALILGLLVLTVAGLGLWMAFGTVNWSIMGLAIPLALVAVGIVGLTASRPRP